MHAAPPHHSLPDEKPKQIVRLDLGRPREPCAKGQHTALAQSGRAHPHGGVLWPGRSGGRAAVTDAAKRLLLRDGFAGTTVAAVAAVWAGEGFPVGEAPL